MVWAPVFCLGLIFWTCLWHVYSAQMSNHSPPEIPKKNPTNGRVLELLYHNTVEIMRCYITFFANNINFVLNLPRESVGHFSFFPFLLIIVCVGRSYWYKDVFLVTFNGSQLAKMKKSIPDMSRPYNL